MSVTLANIKQGQRIVPPITVVYGTHGVGKTSFAASAPSPVFLQTEDGLGLIDAPTFGVIRKFQDVIDAVTALYSEDHQFATLVIDSLDHMEPLIWEQVCKDNAWPSIESPGFGKGYVAALDTWRLLLDGLRGLRDEKNIGVICIAHTQISRFDSPEAEPYDRYSPKLAKSASALIQETADAVMFANYRVATTSTDVGFKKKVTRGIGAGDRALFTEERPAFLAKNRYNMPASISLSWDAFAAHIPFYNRKSKE